MVQIQYGVWALSVPQPFNATVTQPGELDEVCVYVPWQMADVPSVVGVGAVFKPMSVCDPLVTVPGAKQMVPVFTL